MNDAQLSQMAAQWANDILVWTGYGTLVGLLAKAIMPGRDPGGAVTTVLMGIGGSIIGSGTVMYLGKVSPLTPISPMGFLAATFGAFILLAFYRLLSGRFFIEGETRRHRNLPVRRRTRRPRNVVVEYPEDEI